MKFINRIIGILCFLTVAFSLYYIGWMVYPLYKYMDMMCISPHYYDGPAIMINIGLCMVIIFICSLILRAMARKTDN